MWRDQWKCFVIFGHSRKQNFFFFYMESKRKNNNHSQQQTNVKKKTNKKKISKRLCLCALMVIPPNCSCTWPKFLKYCFHFAKNCNSCLIETQLHPRQFKWRTNTNINNNVASWCTHSPALFSAITSFSFVPQACVICLMSSPPLPRPPLPPPLPALSRHSPRHRVPLGPLDHSHVQFIIFMTLPRSHTAARTLSHDAGSEKETYCSCFSFITEPTYTHTWISLPSVRYRVHQR